VDVEEEICGVADVGGRRLTDGRGEVCSGRGRFTDLLVVGVAVGQGGGEDGRVGRDARDVLVTIRRASSPELGRFRDRSSSQMETPASARAARRSESVIRSFPISLTDAAMHVPAVIPSARA
jgi:hypothetical protein